MCCDRHSQQIHRRGMEDPMECAHLTIASAGVRMAVRTPPELRGALAAVFGTV